jgi:serine/threonine protein kinase
VQKHATNTNPFSLTSKSLSWLRGEGPRVNGRSNVFSLGVVDYELLVGRQPFRADSQAEVMEQVTNHEPRRLQLVDGIDNNSVVMVRARKHGHRISVRYCSQCEWALNTSDWKNLAADCESEQRDFESLGVKLHHEKSIRFGILGIIRLSPFIAASVNSCPLYAFNVPNSVVVDGCHSTSTLPHSFHHSLGWH